MNLEMLFGIILFFLFCSQFMVCTNELHLFLSGAYLNTIKRTMRYLCSADIVPPYIDVDLSELDVGQKLVMGDLKVHPALRLLQSAQEPVFKIMGSRISQEQRKSK